jgi:hypothetical protein
MQELRPSWCVSLSRCRRPRPAWVSASAILLMAISSGCTLTGQLDEMNEQLRSMNAQLAQLGQKADAMDQKLGTIERVASLFDAKPRPPKPPSASAPRPTPLTLSPPANQGQEVAMADSKPAPAPAPCTPPVRVWAPGVPEQPTDSLRACNRQYSWHPMAPLLPMSGGPAFPTARLLQ